MRKLEYTFKNDTLFKMLFTQYPGLLKELVAVLLAIPLKSIEKFKVLNPEIPPENLGDKFCRLDINMIVNGQRVDLEVQVNNEGDYPERVMLYWARDFSTALAAGQEYSLLPRTIIISIMDFILFDCAEYHSFFQLLEATRHTLLSDKMGLHFFELPKLPTEISKGNMLLLWLSLFKADTEEELEKIKALEVPVMDQMLNAYYTITAESEFRERERLYAKARHDEAQALHHAKQKGIEEGLAQGMAQGIEKGMAQGIEKGIAQGMEKGLAQGIEKGMAQGIEKGMAQGIEKGMAQGMVQGIEKGMAQGIEKGMAQGIEKGMAQGIEKGMAQGSQQRSFEVASNLKSMGMPFDQISQATGLTHAEIEAL